MLAIHPIRMCKICLIPALLIQITKSQTSFTFSTLTLQAGFPLVQLVFSIFLPESPRWLMANGKIEEALLILARYHTDGDESSTLVEYEQSIENTLHLERESDQSKVRQLVATATNCQRTYIAIILGFFSQWVGNDVVTYYLTLALDTISITNALNQSLINRSLQISISLPRFSLVPSWSTALS
ncbi:hypothetical protein F5884DRAFT_863020 [Xylogone sp. PMI_703]|nr:hypothetical protein F5884DRAFT_863020 [Xylogone sp. PMI_703]